MAVYILPSNLSQSVHISFLTLVSGTTLVILQYVTMIYEPHVRER